MSFPNDELKAVWAPWRSEYFKVENVVEDFLLAAGQSSDDAAHFVVARRKACFLLLNRYPYTAGHMMVVPYQKVSDMEQLVDSEKVEMWDLAIFAQKLLRKAVKAQGFNVGLNLGRCAGAGVVDHLHLHVVPRWEGDRNFMPTLAGVSVIPEGLEEMYRKLMMAKDEFGKEGLL